MSNTLIRDALLLTGVCVAGAWYLGGKADEVESRSAVPAAVVEAAPAPAVRPRQTSTAATLTLRKTNGQFFTDGYADGGSVRFLVDTGASAVALSLRDAETAGFRRHELDYSVTVATANGQTRAAPVVLRTLTVGPITERNVRALVIEEGLEVSLLGMSFLERLQGFEASRDTLTLRL